MSETKEQAQEEPGVQTRSKIIQPKPKEQSTTPPKAKQIIKKKEPIKPVSVELTTLERKRLEKEAAMVFFNNIIENKLSRGEEITQADLDQLDKATDAYEEEIRPFLTIEEVVELDIAD